jgi:predicted nucleotidyltransferase
MLRSAGLLLPSAAEPKCREVFLGRGFFLLHAVKWPLRISARNLRPAERRLIVHSAETHLRGELCALRPSAIVTLGRVALYACLRAVDGASVPFTHRTPLEAVRGQRFDVRVDGAATALYVTALPVRRQRRRSASIAQDISRAVSEQRVADAVRRLASAYRPERIYLFGSHARGDAGPDSDYDLLVVVPDSAPMDRRSSRLGYAALRGTGTAADVLVQSKSYFESRLHVPASLPATILREGRLLYAG